MVKRLILFAVILLLIGSCVSTPVPTATLWAPIQTETFTATPTGTQTPTATNTPTSTSTSTATATSTATLTAIPEFLSPTPIGTGTPSIIEVTAIPGRHYGGWYTPTGIMNVRSCASTACGIFKKIPGGVGVRIYDLYVVKETGDVWLSLDPVGVTWVAYVVNGVEFGNWEPFG